MASVAAVAGAVVVVCVMFAPTADTLGSAWPVLGLLSVLFFVAGGALCVALMPPREAAESSGGRTRRTRLLGTLAVVAVGAGLVGVLGMVTTRVFVPAPEQTVIVQFSDPTGRVVIEYCPTLPGSFEAQARPAELNGTASVVPVRVTADVCGNPAFDRGVWLYLQRAGVTIAVAGP